MRGDSRGMLQRGRGAWKVGLRRGVRLAWVVRIVGVARWLSTSNSSNFSSLPMSASSLH